MIDWRIGEDDLVLAARIMLAGNYLNRKNPRVYFWSTAMDCEGIWETKQLIHQGKPITPPILTRIFEKELMVEVSRRFSIINE